MCKILFDENTILNKKKHIVISDIIKEYKVFIMVTHVARHIGKTGTNTRN